jgi:hypothetical protein
MIQSSGCPPWQPDSVAGPAGHHDDAPLLHHAKGHDPWWLEQGLEKLGKFSPGSSRRHLIYFKKDGSVYLAPQLSHLTVDQAVAQVAAWHAESVAAAEREPDAVDVDAHGVPARFLKLVNSYFPDRLLPVNNRQHLERFLLDFGVPEAEIPSGSAQRNRLLHRLYEAVARPRGLSPWDFVRMLYTRFDPRHITLDPVRLRGSIRLFRWLFSEGFAGQRYRETERDYKEKISERWQKAAAISSLDAAINSGTCIAKARELFRALTDEPSNLLSFQYHPPIKDLTTEEDARLLVSAVRDLLQSASNDNSVPDVGAFNRQMAPLYARLDEGLRKDASRSIPTLMLWLTYPEREIFVRSELFNRARSALGARAAPSDEALLSTSAYAHLRDFAEAVRDGIADLEPADMIDVQSFLWCVFQHLDVWFGGPHTATRTGCQRFGSAASTPSDPGRPRRCDPCSPTWRSSPPKSGGRASRQSARAVLRSPRRRL